MSATKNILQSRTVWLLALVAVFSGYQFTNGGDVAELVEAALSILGIVARVVATKQLNVLGR